MPRIDIEFIDGTKETFEETSRAGGSYCTSIQYKNGFAIIEDAYGKKTSFPESRIKRIEVESNHRW